MNLPYNCCFVQFLQGGYELLIATIPASEKGTLLKVVRYSGVIGGYRYCTLNLATKQRLPVLRILLLFAVQRNRLPLGSSLTLQYKG